MENGAGDYGEAGGGPSAIWGEAGAGGGGGMGLEAGKRSGAGGLP